MFHEQIVSNKRVFSKLHLNRYPVFHKISLVVAGNWLLSGSFDFGFLLGIGLRASFFSRPASNKVAFDNGGFIIVWIAARLPPPLRPFRRIERFIGSGIGDETPLDFDCDPDLFAITFVFHIAPFFSRLCQSSTFSYSMNVQISDKPLRWNVGRLTCLT